MDNGVLVWIWGVLGWVGGENINLGLKDWFRYLEDIINSVLEVLIKEIRKRSNWYKFGGSLVLFWVFLGNWVGRNYY